MTPKTASISLTAPVSLPPMIGDSAGLTQKLAALKKAAEEEAGVTKEILPGGMIRIKDRDGNVVIRAPLPYEVEGN